MSFLEPNTPWRGCAANFEQPLNPNDEREADRLMGLVRQYNPDVVFRNGTDDGDVTRHVIRWVPIRNDNDFQEVFRNGLRSSPQQHTSDEDYYNLERYVNHAGAPGAPRTTAYAFVSTTISLEWHPTPQGLTPGQDMRWYRYEIYAPGGIDVSLSLRESYMFRGQREICFVGGIAPQYIRAVQEFIIRINTGQRFPIRRRANSAITLNALSFNPQPNMPRLYILRPIFECRGENDESQLLKLKIYGSRREKRDVNVGDWWYADDVAKIPIYVTAAFRSSIKNEAYLFMGNEYVRINYAPGTTDDRVINKVFLVSDGFPSLLGTEFEAYGIECAFDIHYGSQALIFCGNLVALIDYAPGTRNDKILEGPMTITSMFPYFKGTVFENSVDAAFSSSVKNEAYLFKGDQYARINYAPFRSGGELISIRKITQGFPSLKGTIFANGIEAAFASHRKDEAYIFKRYQYARINFAPGTTNDYIINGTAVPILQNWKSLNGILPRSNVGVDVQGAPDHAHDEL